MVYDLLVPVAEGLAPRDMEYTVAEEGGEAAMSAGRHLTARAGQLRSSADRPLNHRNGDTHEWEPRKPPNLHCPCGNSRAAYWWNQPGPRPCMRSVRGSGTRCGKDGSVKTSRGLPGEGGEDHAGAWPQPYYPWATHCPLRPAGSCRPWVGETREKTVTVSGAVAEYQLLAHGPI